MFLDMEWHEHESSGSKFKRIERGAQGLQKILRIWVNNAIEIVINLFGIIFIMSRMDLNVGIAVVIFLITYYFLAHYYRKRAVILTNVVNEKDEHRNGIIFESINNIRSVKVMSMAEKIIRILWANAEDMLLSIKERIYWFQFGNSVRNFYGQIFRLAAICFIIYGIIEGKYEVGFLILFTGYFGSVWQSMSELTDVSEDFAIAKNAIYRMNEILKVPITIDSEKDKILFPQDWQKISLNNVSFSYQNKKVLDGVSLEIKRGERVGIVGISGAGKSTLFKLLLKERESYEGEICFDEVSLKDISKKDYFNYLAVVLQETELFNASLRENIIITNQKEEKNAELLVNVIDMAHVKDFMEKLPKGVDSIIGEKGVKLSGGEKQRVGIARAMFKNPQIFLLDEATSHLDIESEETIKDSLHKFFKNVTAVVIAHRLTTIKEMDKIIVIENGKIVEEGSFDELQNKKGRFFKLWEKQKL
jgi:ABC-type multidrug transport system fused ATPase/permease subunit